MFSILPIDVTNIKNDSNNPNILVLNNVNDDNKKRTGKYYIHSSSNVNTVPHLLFDNDNSWNSAETYTNKYDDPSTSNNYQEGVFIGDNNNFSICGGDYYKEGSCISVYDNDNSMTSTIKYIDKDGIEVNVNANLFGESIKIAFPTPYYIFESYLYFGDSKSKVQNYFILGKNSNSQWEIIGKNNHVDYRKEKDILKINKSVPYNEVAFVFFASRESNKVSVRHIKLMGNNTLVNEPDNIYTGFDPYKRILKEYKNNIEGFQNKKKVSFSPVNNIKVIESLNKNQSVKIINNKYSFFKKEYIDYIPGIFISLILGYTIINKK
jgi:hypothetical protein